MSRKRQSLMEPLSRGHNEGPGPGDEPSFLVPAVRTEDLAPRGALKTIKHKPNSEGPARWSRQTTTLERMRSALEAQMRRCCPLLDLSQEGWQLLLLHLERPHQAQPEYPGLLPPGAKPRPCRLPQPRSPVAPTWQRLERAPRRWRPRPRAPTGSTGQEARFGVGNWELGTGSGLQIPRERRAASGISGGPSGQDQS